MKHQPTLYCGPMSTAHPAIQRAEPEWSPFFANSPDVRFIVEPHNIPMLEDFRFERRGQVFLGVHPAGWLTQYCHSGLDRNEGGYGAATYSLTMQDGSTVTLRGPWSGRAATALEQGFSAMQAVSLFEEGARVGRGGFYLPIEVMAATIRHHLPDVALWLVPDDEMSHLQIALPEWGCIKTLAQDRARGMRLDPTKMENWKRP